MGNIVWKKNDGTAVVTLTSFGTDSKVQAAAMQKRGSIPSNWTPVAFDHPVTAVMKSAMGSLEWNGSDLVIQANSQAFQHKLVLQAINALKMCDQLAIRCLQFGEMFPPDWQIYVKSLLALAKNPAGATMLPAKPSVPESLQ